MTFLQKSYGEYSQVEKLVVVTTSYEGSDKEEELEMVPVANNNHSISDSDSNSSEEDFENIEENFSTKMLTTKSKFLPQTTINTKVV